LRNGPLGRQRSGHEGEREEGEKGSEKIMVKWNRAEPEIIILDGGVRVCCPCGKSVPWQIHSSGIIYAWITCCRRRRMVLHRSMFKDEKGNLRGAG
jgi:hypothetical protein